ncbi:MAG TPA: M1 family aminopeptidase [Bryobacteraceae bacterium]|nr:M1 family aminopeptidase [Bryobacteraceae bacterium]
MFRGLAILAFIAPAFALTTAADIGRAVGQLTLDPNECYRVSDLNFAKDDVRIYLTSGYIVFSKQVEGKHLGAIFTTDIEAGDAELLLLPPTRAERLSLASFTESPNLEEHFKAGLMVFTDSTGDDLLSKLHSRESRKNAEMGSLLADRWTPTLRNLADSFNVRLVHDLLSPNINKGMFYMGVMGNTLGNFDLVYDPAGRQQIILGQMAHRGEHPYFNIWTAFQGRVERSDPSPDSSPFTLDNFRIESEIGTDLSMKAVTRVTLTPNRPLGRVLGFNISVQMNITDAKIDGQPAEVFQRESLRSTLISASGNQEFLIVAPSDIDSTKPHELEFHHQGAVIADAGNRVYFVGSRGDWYPHAGFEWSRYDLNFRCPSDLVLVATGEVVDEHIDGDWRIVHRRSSAPIRFAGFNLGDYSCVQRDLNGYKIGVCANRHVENALKRPPVPPLVFTNPTQRRRGPENPGDLDGAPTPSQPNPTARLDLLASDVVGALDFMTGMLGPPPIHTLSISPIPGGFGQGFPGLIYLSTMAYLDPSQLPLNVRDPMTRTFFTDVLEAHETAHQWWGNLVATGGYEDEWLMEALADYTSLMYLEKKKGARALDAVLDGYRNHLLSKDETGGTVESAGPITWGVRLVSSRVPEAWRTITYEKGSWIIHMLRRRLGEEGFRSFLRDAVNQYRYRLITTEQLREVARKYVPAKSPDPDLKQFFDNWVYGTGIPGIKITSSTRGAKVVGTITATEVGNDFSAYVPVEVSQGKIKAIRWLPVSDEPTPFSIPGSRVSLASNDVLIRK